MSEVVRSYKGEVVKIGATVAAIVVFDGHRERFLEGPREQLGDLKEGDEFVLEVLRDGDKVSSRIVKDESDVRS